MQIKEHTGFLVLTVYEPKRRWFRMRSRYEIQFRIPVESGEISYDVAEGWMKSSYFAEYKELRMPANIKILCL